MSLIQLQVDGTNVKTWFYYSENSKQVCAWFPQRPDLTVEEYYPRIVRAILIGLLDEDEIQSHRLLKFKGESRWYFYYLSEDEVDQVNRGHTFDLEAAALLNAEVPASPDATSDA